MKRTSRVRAAGALALLLTVGVGLASLGRVNAQSGQVPNLEVDPLWPQPFALEKHWTLGSVTGVAVDAQDHVWVTHRGLPSLQGNEKGPTAATWAGECCFAAPLVLEYDAAGKLLNNWGGSGNGYQWPQNPSGVTVDAKGNVWIAAAGFPAAAAGGGRGARGAAPGGPAPGGAAAPAAPGAAAPAGGAAAPPAGGGGRGGRGGGGAAAGGAAPAAGAAPAGGAAPAAGGGRGGRGGGGAAAGGAAPAADAQAGGRGAPVAGAPPAGGAAPADGGRGGAPAAAAAPPPPPPVADAHVLKFSKTGQFLLQIGTPGKTDGGPDSQTLFSGPTAVAVDDAANEAYIADSGNRRVVVVDATTGAYKRHWFGTGEKTASPAPPAYSATAPAVKGFRDVSCIKIAKDGMVYVCDSASNRIQVFQKNGTFVKEGMVRKETGGMVIPGVGGAAGTVYAFGSAWDAAFSNDPQQRFLYVADGMNKTVWVMDRANLTVVSRVGSGGRYPGLFYAISSVAVDSKGNLYTGEESDGKRVQKFVNKGMGAPKPLN